MNAMSAPWGVAKAPTFTSQTLERRLFEQRISDLRLQRQSWFKTWMQIRDNLVPTRGMFYEQPGWGREIDHRRILDGHGQRCLNTLASGILSGLTSPSQPWFKLDVTDTDLSSSKAVQVWLNDTRSRIMGVFQRSNIYLALNTIYAELGSFGTATAALLPDPHSVVFAKTFTAGDYFLGCGADGKVDTFGREFWFTVGQLVQEFGFHNCSNSVQNLFREGRVDRWVKVFYLIEPNNDRIPFRSDFKNMPYRALYWEQGAPADQFLKWGGFNHFPILCPRWEVVKTADPYGKGPGWDSLGDIKMVHKLQRDKLIALDKVINPPVQINGNMDGQVNSLPGGVNRFTNGVDAGMKPAYQINPDFEHVQQMISQTKQAISETFYVDLFKMMEQLDHHRMTAAEIAVRNQEKLLQLGPVLSRLESELLDPLIHLTFQIMVDRKLIATPPKQMLGHALEVEYTSPLLQAQKMVAAGPVNQAVQMAQALANLQKEAIGTDVLDNYDLDEIAQKYAEFTGIDPRLMRSSEEVAALRKQKAQAMQQQQQMEQTSQIADSAKKLSETKLGQNSALDNFLSQLKQQGQPNLRAVGQ